jgi:hypothetical protein
MLRTYQKGLSRGAADGFTAWLFGTIFSNQRIMAQPIEVVSIFIAAGDRRDTCHHHFEHRVSDAVGIAPIRHRVCKPPAHTERALLFSQQQPAIGGLVAAVKINCDGWKVEGKRRIVEHGGCGGRQLRVAIRRNTDLLRESRSSRYSRRKILTPDEFSGLMMSMALITAGTRIRSSSLTAGCRRSLSTKARTIGYLEQ